MTRAMLLMLFVACGVPAPDPVPTVDSEAPQSQKIPNEVAQKWTFSPSDGATIPINQVFTATSNVPLLGTLINEASVRLTSQSKKTPGQVQLLADRKTIVFTPDPTPLEYDLSLSFTIEGLETEEGAKIEPAIIRVKTESRPVATPKLLVRATSSKNRVLANNRDITLTFIVTYGDETSGQPVGGVRLDFSKMGLPDAFIGTDSALTAADGTAQLKFRSGSSDGSCSVTASTEGAEPETVTIDVN